jgi:hypothetical protein
MFLATGTVVIELPQGGCQHFVVAHPHAKLDCLGAILLGRGLDKVSKPVWIGVGWGRVWPVALGGVTPARLSATMQVFLWQT